MTHTVEQQRSALEGRLAELRQMNGLPVDLVRQAQEAVEAKRAEMAEIEQQLAQLEAATGARAKTQRADAERARLERRDALRGQMVALEEERLKAFADAEAGVRQLAANIKRVLEVNAVLARTAHTLSGERGVPLALTENGIVGRISARISAIMSSVIGGQYRSRFGGFQWVGASRFPAGQSWREAEESLAAPSIVSIVNKDI